MVSHQEKIKPQHSHLPIDNLLHQILKELSPKYLRPKAFLSLQQKNLEISYKVSHKDFHPKSYCNKYFGRKILYVTDSAGMNRALNSRKLFQRVKFEKTIFSKEGFKATGDLIILGQETPVKVWQITKAVGGCKGKVSIVLNRNIYRYSKQEMLQRRNHKNPIKYNFNVWLRRWIRNCHTDLQSLSLTFQSVDQFPVSIDNLRNLRHLSVKFDKKFARKCGWKCEIFPEYAFKNCQDKHFTFLLQTIKSSPHLQALRLDLAPYSITSMPLAYLLLILNCNQIPDWYVRIGTVSEDFMKILYGVNIEEINKMVPRRLKSTSEVLTKVDFLGLTVVNYPESVDDENTYEKYEDYGVFEGSVARLGELPEVTCKYQKILDVTLTDFSLETYSINLKAMLSHFSRLQGLYIKAVENVVIYEDDEKKQKKKGKKESHGGKKTKQDILPDGLEWTKNLREAFISFAALSGTSDLDFKSQTESFSKFMGALKTHCPQLTSLNVFRAHPVFDCQWSVTICTGIPLIVPCEDLRRMSSLRELEITCENEGLQSIGKALGTLKSLEKFKINMINHDDFGVDDKRTSQRRGFYEFDEKEKILYHVPWLKELELIINKSKVPVKWADHFAKYLPDLKSLEVIKVIDLNKEEIPLEVFMRIIDGLGRRKKLRKVEIDSMIVKSDSALELAAGLLKEKSKSHVEDLMIQNLKGEIEQMVELNPKLELIDIHSFKRMKIERILYDSRTKI